MKPRIFYFAWTPPNKLSGATLAMRRHFVEHDDFEVFVATSGDFHDDKVRSLTVVPPRWLQRIAKTRFWRGVRNLEMCVASRYLPREVVRAACDFKPDAVFTVADLTLSEAARRLAAQLKVPLISNFQDWWPRGQFYYPQERPYRFLLPLFESRFRRLYRQSDLAFCTSEGMREYLGQHRNSHVLYPIGARATADSVGSEPLIRNGGKRRLLYTGTAFGSYGRMLRELATELEGCPEWELVIYGAKPDWPESVLNEATEKGLYRGFLPFERLKGEILSADACLAVMSFEKDLEIMMKTSFTTKLLDYCSSGKPAIIWGPSFCSPVRLAKAKQAALTVETSEASGVVGCLKRLTSEQGLSEKLAAAATALAGNELSHDVIHTGFVRHIQRLVEDHRKIEG